jgi:DNA repair exonuclease SbcCD ATPase subunit/DNA repair exonuclease SbcCD nuclease subunit
MNCLPLPKAGRVRHIIHLADTHIRTGDPDKSRYHEYSAVFENLCASIASMPSSALDQTVIVITGDIFHNKSRIESSGIKLFTQLINGLSKLAPTYIIQGNHDYRQDQVDIPDLISAFLTDTPLYDKNNVYYLNATGHYCAGDIGFGLVDIKETLLAGDTSGQVSELPPFPDPLSFPESIKTKIALFHGTIIQSTLQNYSESTTGYPLKWFDGYELLLLGDIHLRQIHNATPPAPTTTSYSYKGSRKRPVWAYPGSLNQQNYGELLFDHGYLHWDLEQKTVTPVNVQNPVGFVTAQCDSSTHEWYGYYKTRHPLRTLLEHPNIPSTLYVRTIGEPFAPSDTVALHTLANQYGIVLNITNKISDNVVPLLATTTTTANGQVAVENSTSDWIKYITDTQTQFCNETLLPWKQWLEHPETLSTPLPPPESNCAAHLLQKVKEKNDKVVKYAEQLTAAIDSKTTGNKRPVLQLQRVEWQWMLCFRDQNWFDFTTLTNNVAIINANNGYGKSSFLEIICLGLYGESIPSRTSKSHPSAIICKQKPKGQGAFITLHFIIEQCSYILHRTFEAVSSNTIKLQSKVTLSKVAQPPNKPEQIHSGKLAVNHWIEDHVGNMDTFLLSCMMTQNADHDFFSMKACDQITLLDKTMNLEPVTYLLDFLKQAQLAYTYIKDHMETHYHQHTSSVTETTLQRVQQEHTHSRDQLQKLENDVATIEQQLSSLPKLGVHLEERDLQQSPKSIQSKLDTLSLKAPPPPEISPTEAHRLEQEKTILDYKLSLLPTSARDYPITTTSAHLTQETLDVLAKQEPPKPSSSYTETPPPTSTTPPTLEELKEQLERLELTFQQLQTQQAQHLTTPPPTPEKTRVEYETWRMSLQPEEAATFDAGATTSPLPSRPPVPKETLVLYQHELAAARAVVAPEHHIWVPSSAADSTSNNVNIQECHRQLTEQWEKLHVHQAKVQTHLEHLCETYRYQQEHLTAIKTEYDLIKAELGAHHHRPRMTLQECQSWLQEYEDDIANEQATIAAFKEAEQALADIATYSQTLEKLEFQQCMTREELETLQARHADIPHNSDCWACQQQPWKLQIQHLTTRLAEIDTQLHEHRMSPPPTSSSELYHTYKQKLDSIQERRKHYSTILETREKAIHHERLLQQQHDLTTKLQNHQDIVEGTTADMTACQETLRQIHKEITCLQQPYRDIQYCFKNYKQWEEHASALATYLPLWQRYEAAYWHIALRDIEQYEQWQAEQKELEASVNKTRKDIHESKERYLSRQWTDWHQRYTASCYHVYTQQQATVSTALTDYKEYLEAMAVLNYWREVQTAAPIYKEKQKLAAALESTKEQRYKAQAHHTYLSQLVDEYTTEAREAEAITTYIKTLGDYIVAIQQLFQAFGGYRMWVYSNKILPRLVHECNQLVASITTPQRTLALKFSLSGTLASIQWTLQDGDNEIILTKASGFQRFIIGLAIRIVLSYIGASSINCRQLFIDEGFSACDAYHLKHMPNFIHGLIGRLYDTVLLVSHLEMIKDAADVEISIQRSHRQSTSTLQHGPRPNQTTRAGTATRRSRNKPQQSS